MGWFECNDSTVLGPVKWNTIKSKENNAYVICWAKENVELSDREPTGIYRADNTCYFNTLLQILFNVIEIERRYYPDIINTLFPEFPEIQVGGGSGAGVYTYIKEKFKNNNMNENIKAIEDKNKSQTKKEN